MKAKWLFNGLFLLLLLFPFRLKIEGFILGEARQGFAS